MDLRWMCGAALLALLFVTPVNAQVGDVSGPGQAVAQPPAQCPQTIACQYNEQNLMSSSYRLQSLMVCGANCTTQYWVSSLSDGAQLLEIDPVRGGAVVAVSRDPNPSVRVVQAAYGPNDPACCPSGFDDTTYAWDAGSNSLVAGEPQVTPADQFPGYDAVRQELAAEGWLVANV
ncbi:MAG: hypothetical protein JO020_03735 [Chloroflexi bacterium]|nr:hypothetical protein [Chloroflexota bacterium]MBV9893262.1 hypothetical protein [Chloroflexota bacterium]